MRAKFVVRLLNAADELLGWDEVFVEHESGGWFRPRPMTIRLDRAGVVSRVSIHWTDLDVARLWQPPTPWPTAELQSGQEITLQWGDAGIWSVPGEPNVPRPTVTVRGSVTVGIPASTAVAGGAVFGR